MHKELPNRKRNRLGEFNYSAEGEYFITICVKDRREILSEIVGDDACDVPQIKLSSYGKILEKHISEMSGNFKGINVYNYVIMPNHVHLILQILYGDGTSQASSPTKAHIPMFVSQLKRNCNHEIGENIWQRSYHDRVIRNGDEFEKIDTYVRENPYLWKKDCFYNVGDDARDIP
jgi:REP element-mobilizing transposase RayT